MGREFEKNKELGFSNRGCDEKRKDEHRYDDIIDLPHPTSRKHPRMSMQDRAAQFAAFAALTGHGEAIEETAQEHIASYEKE